jgi:HSP20 family molecular chaperone IbpA
MGWEGRVPARSRDRIHGKAEKMSIILRRDPRTVIPDVIDWFEEPFLTLKPYLGQPVRIEDYTEDGHYVVRAEIAGIDPEKELEVSVGAGYISIRAERSGQAEGKHRSEFRYGSLSRTLELPPGADASDVTAEYVNGILTIRVALKGGQRGAVKTIPVTLGEK